MKMIKLRSLGILASTLLLTSIFTACSKDDTADGNSASTAIKVTDAPIDDASVSGAFITIADIKLDGQSVQGFTKTTVDIKAYQNGATKTIGNFNLEGKTYNSISFVLDFNTDASGNAPGSYIMTTAGVKHKLESSTNIITITKNFALQPGVANSIVADFDLRKMIRYQAGTADHYDFASAADLQTSVRVVTEGQAGTISGSLTDNVSGSGKVVAYAYKKGTFNRTTEMQAQGESGIHFKNAVSSSLVTNNAYSLHFLENGEYEVHFASYKDTNADGEFELKGTLIVTSATGINLLGLNLGANTTLTANATATAVLP